MKAAACSIIVLSLLLCSVSGKGQCPSDKGQVEIAVSYGLITSDELSEKVSLSDNTVGNKTSTYNSGAPFVTLRYFLFNRLAIGFAGGVTKERGQYTDSYNPAIITSTYKQRTTTVGFELYYIYVFRKYFEAYTLAGFGPSFVTTVTTTNATAYIPASVTTASRDVARFQYTPIGVRVGGRLGAFAELGIGYKGVFNAGVSFRLGPSCWWKE